MRRLLVLAMVLAAAVLPHPATAHDGECAGYAPLQTTCSTGDHVWNGGTHGVDWQTGFTGSIYSVLTWPQGQRTYRCTVYLGERTVDGCSGYGDFPPAGTVTRHFCATHWPDDAPIYLSDGGLLNWSCHIRGH